MARKRIFHVDAKDSTILITTWLEGTPEKKSHCLANIQPLFGNWFIDDLLVVEEERRHGVGATLVEKIKEQVIALRAKDLFVLPGGDDSDDIRSMAFWYYRMGFRKHEQIENSGIWIMRWKPPRRMLRK